MLGKNLTRRAGSLCELCNGADDLRVIEIAPVSESPSEDAAILACAACRDVLTAKRLPKDTEYPAFPRRDRLGRALTCARRSHSV